MAQGPFAGFAISICGVEELAIHRERQFTHIVSIADPKTPQPEALTRFPAHYRLDLRFHDASSPGPKVVLASVDDVEQLLAFGRQAKECGARAHLLIHCHAGLSRSTAAAVLCLAEAFPARSAYEVLGEVVRRRPEAWPNLHILELGDRLLGRQGELITAVSALYRRVLDANPARVEHLRQQNRNRELALAARWL